MKSRQTNVPVNAGTVQRISRPFDGASVAAA
jgi:hypothetical protein